MFFDVDLTFFGRRHVVD